MSFTDNGGDPKIVPEIDSAQIRLNNSDSSTVFYRYSSYTGAAGSYSGSDNALSTAGLHIEIDAKTYLSAVTIVCSAPVSSPTVTSISPTSGTTAGGTSVTIVGTNLTGATAVTIGGTPASGVTVNSATSITATTPAHGAGAVDVAVTTPGGTATLTNGFAYLAPVAVSPASGALASGTVGTSYSQTITASSGTSPFSYAVTSGALPAGLSLDPSTGVISGTPTAAGGSSFTITATDAAAHTGSASYTLGVAATVPGEPGIGSAAAGDGGATITFTAPASNGGASITGYTITSNPGGITAAGSSSPITVTGLTSGTAYTFTVTATNSAGTGPASAASNSVVPTPALLPPVANAVSAMVAANSLANPITLNITGGAATSVAIATQAAHGTVTASGMSITYTPASGYSGSDSFTYTAENTAGTSAPATVSVTVTAPTFAFSPASGALAAGMVGTSYSQTVTASAGTAPYAYALTGGTLPAGLSLDPSTGLLSGTPTATGSFSLTITATDGVGATGSAAYTLTVSPAPVSFEFTPAGGALTAAMAGEDYSQAISASGGTGALIYSLASGTLPHGMVLNISTGELTGPLAADAEGDYAFAIQVRDGAGHTGSANYTLQVKPRAITVTDKTVEVSPGSTPPNVYLNRGATGGPFNAADVTYVEPANAGTAAIVRGVVAQAGLSVTPVGWYLQFTPNPAYSGSARVGFQLTSALGISNAGMVTYNLGFNATQVAEDVDSLVHDFVQTRQNLIASTIKVPGLLERRRMETATDPVTTRMMPSDEGITLGFSTSLAQIEAARNSAYGVEGASSSPFNIWIDGAFLAYNSNGNGGKWGNFAMVSLGADYLLSEKALVGLSFHYDRMTDPTDEDAKLTGNGWLAGPYASVEIGKGVFWDTSLLYGGSSNDIDTELWDGTFDTSRWFFDTSISGQWKLDDVTVLTPKLRAVYFSEKVDNYAVTNGLGDEIGLDGFTEEQLRVSVGAEIARSFTLDDGKTLTPKFAATAGFSGLDGSGLFGSISAGVSLQAVDAWSIDAGLLFNIEGDGETSAGAKVGVRARF